METDPTQHAVDEGEADQKVADATAAATSSADISPAATSPAETPPDEVEPPRSLRGRVGHTLSGWRQLGRIAWRDPEHVAERLTLYSASNLGETSLEWAANVRAARPEE